MKSHQHFGGAVRTRRYKRGTNELFVSFAHDSNPWLKCEDNVSCSLPLSASLSLSTSMQLMFSSISIDLSLGKITCILQWLMIGLRTLRQTKKMVKLSNILDFLGDYCPVNSSHPRRKKECLLFSFWRPALLSISEGGHWGKRWWVILLVLFATRYHDTWRPGSTFKKTPKC